MADKYPMFLTAGYLHPQHGFLFADHIPADQTEEWMAVASIILTAHNRIQIDGQVVDTRDLIPVMTFDPGLDRLLCRAAGQRCVPDHLARSIAPIRL